MLGNRKLKIEIKGTDVFVTNLTDYLLENCLIDIKTILYGTALFNKFDINPSETIHFNLMTDTFFDNWINEKLYVKVYTNHKLIYEKKHNDKRVCFVVLTNQKFEPLVEKLIIGLDRYTDVDILHYSIGYKSNLNYTNLTNVDFNIDGDLNDGHYMQFSKAPVFLDVIERGYQNGIFLDADIQVKSNISDILKYIDDIEEGPILQKGAWDYTTVHGMYVPGPLLREFLQLPDQKFPHGITNIVLFNKSHKDLFQEWESICFSDEIKKMKEVEFLHDELILNCLFWKNNIKPKYFWPAINVLGFSDVKLIYSLINSDYIDKKDLNSYGSGHMSQSFVPYNLNEIMCFHCVKDVEEADKINEYIYKKEIRNSFSKDTIDFYKDITKVENRFEEDKLKSDIRVVNHYVNGPYLEISADKDREFNVTFENEEGVIHSTIINGNMWTKVNREYYENCLVTVTEDGEVLYSERINLEGKRVFVTLESSSLGDTLAWFPCVEEFRKKHNCVVMVSTFMNDLFRDQYPDLVFVEPGSGVDNIYAMYKIGWFYDEDLEVNFNKNPFDFRNQPMQKTAADILGLDYKEVRPLMKLPNVQKKKKVGVGIHGTAQTKYWNNPNGWQEVVDYLNSLDYEVMLYSREGDGYMGNYHPTGITKFVGGSVQEVINDMATCEFFIGIGSGLSWLAWAAKLPIVLISGFSYDFTETSIDTYRVINKSVCTGCFNTHRLDPGDWNWCPLYKDTDRQFECTKSISTEMVISEINKIINLEVTPGLTFEYSQRNDY